MNRSNRYTLGFNPDRPSDKTVEVIKFENLSGEPIAILINYAVHAVVLFTAMTKGEQREVSADLPGPRAAWWRSSTETSQ